MTSPTPLSDRLPRPGTVPEPRPEPSSLHSKMVEVVSEVGWIEKGGRNTVQGYDFVRDSDVADAVRQALAKHRLTMVPAEVGMIGERDLPTKNDGRQQLFQIRVVWRITDADSGESMTVESFGSGTDSGDKAPYKAMTGARKYALLTTFLIPTGDDPENDEHQGAARPAQPGRRTPVSTAPRTTQGRPAGDAPVVREAAATPPAGPSSPAGAAASTPDELTDEEWGGLVKAGFIEEGTLAAPAPLEGLSMRDLFDRADAANVDKKALSAAGTKLYGQWSMKALNDEQRAAVAEEVGL